MQEMTNRRSLLGIGLYPVAQATRLVRAHLRIEYGADSDVPSRDSVRRWAKGYGSRRGEGAPMHPPVIRSSLAEAGLPDTLTFADLVELHFVAVFRCHGVSMPTIRRAAERAAQRFGKSHPFAVRRFSTDGKTIFAELREQAASEPPQGFSRDAFLEDLNTSQGVFDDFVAPFIKRIVQWGDDDVARLLWPLGRESGIVLDPERAFGKPIHHESGVPTRALFEASQSGETYAEIAEWYDLPEGAVHRAVDYERELEAA